MDEAQLAGIVRDVIKEVNAQSPNDMGKVMKGVLAKVAGKADSKAVSDMVKKSLSGA